MPISAQALHTFRFDRGLNAGRTFLSRELEGFSADGSANAILLGDGYYKPFFGLNSQGANTGSRVMKPIGKTWGGIKDVGVTQGAGSVSEEIGRSVWGIGAGQVHVQGTDISGFTLSTLLKLVLLASGVYQTPVTAGLSQPSAPLLGITANAGSPNGAISAKLERRRPSTGARSLASLTSEVVVPAGSKIRVTFPAASTGQTHWRFYVTLMGFGGQGIHYLLAYNGSLDIPESTVAAGTVDGVARSLEFDWKDGDLIPEEASYDDYAPPAATHMLRILNVMILAGAYADSVTSPTSTNTGVAIAVSKPNNFESYVPTHLLFLPEQVVDTLARPIDEYGYIGCESSIHAIQYVGPREDELPACTITTVLQDVGIQYPHNWTQFRGRLCVYTAEGHLLLMSETGELDTEFASPIRKLIKNWQPVSTVVGYDPKNDCIVLFNGRTVLIYSIQSGGWSAAFLKDYGFSAGSVASCQAAKRRLYVTITNGSNSTAYEFDSGAADLVPLSFVSHYTGSPDPSLVKNIYQAQVSVDTSYETSPVVLCINRNLQDIAHRGISTNLLNNRVTASAKFFNASMDGKRFALFAPDIGGAGIDYILGRMTYSSTTTADLTDEAGVPLSFDTAYTELLMFIGDYVEAVTLTAYGEQHLSDFFPNVPDAKSFAVALWFQTEDDNAGSIGEVHIHGSTVQAGRAE